MTVYATSDGAPVEARRAGELVLTDVVALTAFVSTLPYQVYYLLAGPDRFLPVLLVNLAFLAVYAAVPALNRASRTGAARVLVLAGVYVHLAVVTALIGTGAGVHFFYFPLASALGVVVIGRREVLLFGLVALAFALFVGCELALSPESALLEIPPRALEIMRAFSAVGAIASAGTLPYVYRLEIERAHGVIAQTNAELARLSGLDPLTGIPNRRTFDAHLAREWSRAARERRPISLLLVDVDRFKAYNDRYGHQAGDRCIQRVADSLRGVAARGGDLVARYGGEEFVAVLPETDVEGAVRFGERIRAAVGALELPHEAVAGAAPFVSVSVGVAAAVPGPEDDPLDLLRRADEALYRAKREGRDRVRASA